jgi:uncharacterized protein YbjQ (UPF0145 family)
MILSTTTAIEGRPVSQYLGVVTGEVIGSGGSMLMVTVSGTAVRL